MAIKPGEPKKLTANDCIKAVALYFDHGRNLIVPNVQMFGCELDVACLSKSGYLTEVEVKISLGDWHADRLKTKWQHAERTKYVNRFYYAVPFHLISKVPDWITEEVG